MSRQNDREFITKECTTANASQKSICVKSMCERRWRGEVGSTGITKDSDSSHINETPACRQIASVCLGPFTRVPKDCSRGNRP